MSNFFYRNPNTTTTGLGFSSAVVEAVWQKATIVAGYDARFVRRDACGVFIQRLDYGNTNSRFGWEIDHIQPVARQGNDHLSNLQPLQWENNRYKSDNYPHWTCKLKAA